MVALASFPGSGNTWFRYLLQQFSGILTGSIYKDYDFLLNEFLTKDDYNLTSFLVVKTHSFGMKARKPFQKVILLVRDPIECLQAEFNRKSSGPRGHASQYE